jgi:ArsR family transcriptional regulator
LILETINDSELCVNDIINNTGLEQTLVSFHLKALKNCGLVINRRDGKKVMYSVSNKNILNILQSIKTLVADIEDLPECSTCE